MTQSSTRCCASRFISHEISAVNSVMYMFYPSYIIVVHVLCTNLFNALERWHLEHPRNLPFSLMLWDRWPDRSITHTCHAPHGPFLPVAGQLFLSLTASHTDLAYKITLCIATIGQFTFRNTEIVRTFVQHRPKTGWRKILFSIPTQLLLSHPC